MCNLFYINMINLICCCLQGNVVYIYTKSFSGFYCTTCGHRELKLKAFLFGSYKRFQPNRHEVRLMMYVADEVFKIQDYRRVRAVKYLRHNQNKPLALFSQFGFKNLRLSITCISTIYRVCNY